MRYITKPPRGYVGDDFDYSERPDQMDVLCEDDAPVKTGLYDAAGQPLYRVPDRVRMGFCK